MLRLVARLLNNPLFGQIHAEHVKQRNDRHPVFCVKQKDDSEF